MAAEVIRIPAALRREAREIVRPVVVRTPRSPVPYPAPLLHPDAIQALLMAFSPLGEAPKRG
jgi:hypothetical protein